MLFVVDCVYTISTIQTDARAIISAKFSTERVLITLLYFKLRKAFVLYSHLIVLVRRKRCRQQDNASLDLLYDGCCPLLHRAAADLQRKMPAEVISRDDA